MDNHTIQFIINGKHVKFTVDNNLSEYKLDIEAAVINWTARLRSPAEATCENFCKYVISKDPLNLICKNGKKL